MSLTNGNGELKDQAAESGADDDPLNSAANAKLNWRNSTHIDFESLAIQESYDTSQFSSKCCVTPIVMSSTFQMDNVASNWLTKITVREDGSKVYEYGRIGNPTRHVLENMLAKFDGASYGLAFSSGTAAIIAVTQLLRQGDHLISAAAVYGGSYGIYKNLDRFGITTSFVLHQDQVEEYVELIRPNTKMIAIECCANPTLTLVDIQKLVHGVRIIKGRPDIIISVDNTFLTPICQRPLELGADVVIYSCSKYLNGHGDLIMGALTLNSDELHEKLKYNQSELGGVPSPFDCYLLIRSMKTLPLRMKQHYKNALAVAQYLESHPEVEKVAFAGKSQEIAKSIEIRDQKKLDLDPGNELFKQEDLNLRYFALCIVSALKSHPQHKLALAQQFGNCGMVGVHLKGGFKAAEAFLKAIKVFQRASSLGADFSLASIPSLLSHTELDDELKEILGITDNFIRLSVGLEGISCLLNDLEQALSAASASTQA